MKLLAIDPESRTLRIAVLAVVVALVSNALGSLVVGSEPGGEADADWPGFVIALVIVLLVAGVLFLWAIPGIVRGPSDNNTPALWGLALSVLSIVAIPTWWLGVPFVLAAAGLALGLVGLERAPSTGRKNESFGALVIGGAIFVFLIFVSISDELS